MKKYILVIGIFIQLFCGYCVAAAYSPTDAAYLKTARTYATKNEYNKALPYYHKVLKNHPNNSDLLIETARVTGWADKNKKSAELYERALKAAPQRENDILRALGWQLLWSNQPYKAMHAFQGYLKNHPTDKDANKGLISAQLEIARKLVKQQKYIAALKYYHKVLRKRPNDSDLIIEVARVTGWADKNRQSAKLYERAIHTFPNRKDDVLRALGWQLLWSQQPYKASRAFNNYLRRHPNDRDAKKGLYKAKLEIARLHVNKKHYRTALRHYLVALRQHPNNSDLLIEIARVYGWNNQHKKAIHYYHRALSVAPRRKYDILRPLAWQLIWDGQLHRANELFHTYLDKFPNDENAMLGLARSYEDLRNNKLALSHYLWVIKNHPKNIDAYFGAARIYLTTYKYKKARNMYQRVLTIKPDNLDAIAGVARANNLWGKHREAARLYMSLSDKKGKLKHPYQREKAYAQYWAGFNELAFQSLIGLDDADSNNLRIKVLRGLKNPIETRYDGATDSDGLDIGIYSIFAGLHLNPTTLLLARYRLFQMVQAGIHVTGHEFLTGLATRVGSLYTSYGTHWPTLLIGFRSFGNWQSFAWRFYDKWIPSDFWQIDFEAGNNIIDNVPSILNRVLYTYAALAINHRIWQRVLLTGAGTIYHFDDGNVRPKILGRVMLTVFYHPHVDIGAETYYFSDSKPFIFRGYYNPADYWEGRFIAVVSHYILGWYLMAKGTYGRLAENPGQSGNLFSYEFVAEKDLKKYGVIRIYYGHSNSLPGSSTALNPIGYRRNYWGISYNVSI